MIVVDGQPVHFEQTGCGAPVLFVPGSYSTPAAWKGVQACLSDDFRLLGTSLNGYGRTAETRSLKNSTIAHGVRVIEAVARHIGEPLHLVGHSYGGYLALAAALAGNIDLLSLSLFEANPIPVVKPARTDLFARTETMATEFAAAIASADPNAAALIIDFWGGQDSFDSMPAAVQDYCRSTASTNLLDWRAAMAADVSAQDFSALDTDVLLVRGSKANDVMVEITDQLHSHLPNAEPHVVDDAGHFLISSHPAQCGALLAQFLARVA